MSKVRSFYVPWFVAKAAASHRKVLGIKAPLWAGFFAWSAVLGKILIMDNLGKGHVIVVDKCCMCKKSGDSMNHLLLHCDTAYAIWIAFFDCFGLSWVMLRHVVNLHACWWTTGNKRSVATWKMAPMCLL